MKTIKLYQSDVYIKQWTSKVIDIQKCEDHLNMFKIILEKTAFFPEGGGQSCDTGYIDNIKVVDVQENDYAIYHTLICESKLPFDVGSNVTCCLDWDRRFDNMQRHLGEHILSGAIFNLYRGTNRGFHMGHNYMTIDISLPQETHQSKGFTNEMASSAQLCANKTIWHDKPVTVLHFDKRREAEKLPLRKPLAFDENISVVTVGDLQNPDDCVACCGTHPSTTGQVGLIKIYKVEKYKGMHRIFFDAGKRALSDYDFKHNMLMTISSIYSSSVEDVPQKIKSHEEKIEKLKDKIYNLKKSLIENECRNIDDKIIKDKNPFIMYKINDLSLDDITDISKRYSGKCNKLLMLYSPEYHSYIITSSGDPDCGHLVKKYAALYNGKGGGKNISARAVFSTQSDALLFSDSIKQYFKNKC